MHLGQAGLDLNNVYLKYHTYALTASNYIMNKFIPSQITGFYNFFQRVTSLSNLVLQWNSLSTYPTHATQLLLRTDRYTLLQSVT